MNINDLTVAQVKDIASLFPTTPHKKPARDFEIGENVLIMTVTTFWVGTVTKETSRFVHLSPAAWVADTGRFFDALKNGTLSEVEPCVGLARVAIGGIINVVPWSHAVPASQK